MEPESHEEKHQRLERRSQGNRDRLLDLAMQYHNLANRVHGLEDKFDTGGIIEQLASDLERITAAIEKLVDIASQGNEDDNNIRRTEIGSNA